MRTLKKIYFLYTFNIVDDHSRVVLGSTTDDGGYVNANYIEARITLKEETIIISC